MPEIILKKYFTIVLKLTNIMLKGGKMSKQIGESFY